ncbi:MAG TPA: type II toxin-antitoxin system RelE/ParE family toxin [Pararhizobium sp.]|uniref:type II toxin-antitoxin system RelE/ParE family toxin n=1 Tax=Pararhizobium sp. TaxID=1977563 RepID=UPI002D002BA0|nr:type II toxin-antitoxin system RelE/ParE family toxin [Pararhizobium sp.]HTO32880.1 type II toxin-antitoxin system RelE/ParE family toxin [Pararhizobium sp.]
MPELKEYLNVDGTSPFADWFNDLDAQAAARIVVSLNRLQRGNISKVKGIGGGLQELKIDYGPGYRVYFGIMGNVLILLLGGGTKKRQQRDIDDAHARWLIYKRRKTET